MDHLPVPPTLKLGSLTIPLLSSKFGFEYYQESRGWEAFEAFPASHGFTLKELACKATESPRVSAFLQSWLFFGLLRETFSRPDYCYKPEDFVSCTSRDQSITTKALPRYTWYWQAARTHDDPDTMKQLEEIIDKCLDLAHRVLWQANQSIQWPQDADIVGLNWPDEVRNLFSITLLGDYLSKARRSLRFYVPGPILDWEFPPLDRLMMEAGWCEGEISTLKLSCGLSARCYLSGIDRTCLKKKHDRCNAEVGCLAYQLDYHTYRTGHCSECPSVQDCPEIGPLVEDIVSAIRNGGSALVDATDVAVDKFPRIIQVGGAGGLETVRYVAISHVWSDGLGNPWRNCLPFCQLRRIQRLVSSLYESTTEPVYFWIDTLGIPVDKPYVKYRQAAIARIAHTFGQADAVLVLDSSLQLCKADIPLVEMLMRIQHSPWMTRVWTFLEGNIAPRLYFQFADGVTYGDDLMDPSARKNSLMVSEVLKELPGQRLRSCPSAIQLIRGLATARPLDITEYYGVLSDAELDELREEAIRRQREEEFDYAIGEFWRHFLSTFNYTYEVSDDDAFVKADITIMISCPVLQHAFKSVASVRGAALQAEPGQNRCFLNAGSFEEACKGLVSRTTSRLDDETICLGTILGADLESIMSIPTMDWRWREWLDSLDNQRSSLRFVRQLGINTRQYTEACHLRRMVALLSQIPQFPISIIFWNTPRLATHSWAPRSLLDRNLITRLPQVQGYARLTKSELELTISAFRLGCQRTDADDQLMPTILSPGQASFPIEVIRGLTGRMVNALSAVGKIFASGIFLREKNKVSSHDDNILTISPQGQIGGNYATSWLHVRFQSDDRSVVSAQEKKKTWQDYIDDGMMDSLALLFRGSSGVLVRVCGEEDGRYIVQHIRLVEKTLVAAPGITVAGYWINQGTWRVL